MAPAFRRSADFAVDKPAGTPCRNLLADHRCSIHASLRDRGFPGCVAFDCFGAGQRVVQETFGGRGRRGPEMFAAFDVMRALHELLWYLAESLTCPAAAPLHPELRRAQDDIDRHAEAELSTVDVDGARRRVGELLTKVSRLVRGDRGPVLRGADLAGRDLRRRGLANADLRGALLIGADLRGVDLSHADLLGADLRAAKLHDTDLGTALFLTQPQLSAAEGTPTTGIPPHLTRPGHWS